MIILDFWGYLQTAPSREKKKIFLNRNFYKSKKMEDHKEMFAQTMKFQMESQQKNEEKLLQLQKENEERILKNEEKQQRFFLELQKQQETLFKSLSNNHTAISPKIKRPDWTFFRHVKASTRKSIGYSDGQGTTAISAITPNPNTPLAVSPAETMFARKIRSVFDKLLPKQNKPRKTTLAPKKWLNPGEKITLKISKQHVLLRTWNN